MYYRLAVLLCLMLLLRSLPAMAQTEIHHCIGSNGGAVFTDQPCAALQATPVQRMPATVASSALPEAIQPPLVLCVTSLSQLRQSVIDAFANRDPNRMAGLMLWGGYGSGAAIADIRSLAAAMKQPLVGIDLPGARDSSNPAATPPSSASSPPDPFAAEAASTTVAAPPASQLVLHTGGMDGSGASHDLHFDIVHQAGCLWLRNAD